MCDALCSRLRWPVVTHMPPHTIRSVPERGISRNVPHFHGIFPALTAHVRYSRHGGRQAINFGLKPGDVFNGCFGVWIKGLHGFLDFCSSPLDPEIDGASNLTLPQEAFWHEHH